MRTDVSPVPLEDVLPLRELYRREMNCQIIHDSWAGRGWVDSFLCRIDGRVAGYGLVGGIRAKRKVIVTEFFVLPDHRAATLPLFRGLVSASGAKKIETQSNDFLLTLMLFDTCTRIKTDRILFRDGRTTHLAVAGARFQKRKEGTEWEIVVAGQVAATGGILFHYNVPYGDIYMETAEGFRRRGYGSLLVQELKRTCYEMGKIPAARCNATNEASRATLQKAGFLPCGRMFTGVIAK